MSVGCLAVARSPLSKNLQLFLSFILVNFQIFAVFERCIISSSAEKFKTMKADRQKWCLTKLQSMCMKGSHAYITLLGKLQLNELSNLYITGYWVIYDKQSATSYIQYIRSTEC